MIFSLGSFINMHAMDIHECIEKNKNSPKELAKILTEVASWEESDLDLGAVKKILELGISADAKDRGNIFLTNRDYEVLTTAASYGKTDYVKLLLDFGADIETKSFWDDRTALSEAAFGGHDKTIALLLQHGANLNGTNYYKKTASMFAAEYGEVDVVKILLAADADMSLKDIAGNTALDYAKKMALKERKEKYVEIVMLLEKKQKDLELEQAKKEIAARINAFTATNKSCTNIHQLIAVGRR